MGRDVKFHDKSTFYLQNILVSLRPPIATAFPSKEASTIRTAETKKTIYIYFEN